MDWNVRYENEDTPWDKGAASPVLEELLEKRGEYFKKGGKALIPGCGRGHDAMPLVEAGMSVDGMDISALALAEADNLYGSSDKLRWVKADLFKLGEEWESSYDLVWEHTCYCAIDPSLRMDYADAVLNILKPGAYLVGVFFVDTQMPIGEGPPYETSRDEVNKNFQRNFNLIWEGKPEKSYEGRENREWVMIWQKKE